MNTANSALATGFDSQIAREVKIRRPIQGIEPTVLTNVYQEETNIVIWQRQLSSALQNSVNEFLQSQPSFQASMTVTPQTVLSSIAEVMGGADQSELCENIAELVDIFCCLFDLRRTGLRLTALDRAMCPKFHVDKVPCRLVTTYQGVATEWLPHSAVNREKLGMGSQGKPDNESGLYQNQQEIQKLSCGDVALLKGELWEGNENAGLVHRSPVVTPNERRLLLTLDFSG